MTRPIFIFISSLLLLFPVVVTSGSIASSTQLLYCMPFILLLGIPHGAIDNVLFINKKELSLIKFISVYLAIIGANVLLWLILPHLAYTSFLILSAYHFGQSQFSHYLDNNHFRNKTLYLFWGVSILSALIYFNLAEIAAVMIEYNEFSVFQQIHAIEWIRPIFLTSTTTTLVFLGYLTINKRLTTENLIMEVLLLALVLVCFYLMPLLIGFTLYFVILHSLKVLREEFTYLAIKEKTFSLKDFVKMVAPFTLFSFLGMAFLFALVAFGIIKFSYGYVFLITISSITLPHALVMNRFYNMLSFGGLNKRLTT